MTVMVCPKDLLPCCDDLCIGGGCLQSDGAPMLYKCRCGAYISDDDATDCVCEPDDYE